MNKLAEFLIAEHKKDQISKQNSQGVINVQITEKKVQNYGNAIPKNPELNFEIKNNANSTNLDILLWDVNNKESFDSKYLNKKKSVINIVKIPLVPPKIANSYKINKKLLKPLSLNSQMKRSSEK